MSERLRNLVAMYRWRFLLKKPHEDYHACFVLSGIEPRAVTVPQWVAFCRKMDFTSAGRQVQDLGGTPEIAVDIAVGALACGRRLNARRSRKADTAAVIMGLTYLGRHPIGVP
jgi:hypothetical protein